MAAIGELTPYFSFGIIGDPQYAEKVSGGMSMGMHDQIIASQSQSRRNHMQHTVTIRLMVLRFAWQCSIIQEDGHVEGRVQRHREVPDKLREAVKVFADHPESLQFVLVLGDFIDGRIDEVWQFTHPILPFLSYSVGYPVQTSMDAG